MLLPRRATLAGSGALLLSAAFAAACGPQVDLKQALQVVDVTTGWYDAGIVAGKNKLVPSASFRLRNTAERDLGGVQLNVVFVLAPDASELDDTYTRGIGPEGLKAGETSPPFVIRAKFGFTGEQPRAEMLQHGQFRDARVRIFAKHRSGQWIPLGEFPVQRQLLTN